jgi:hypothetical protein
MIDVAKLTKQDLRTVWPNEASDFTPWLAEHLDELAQALGMDLELVETEAPVGLFSVDILAKETNTNRYVVIENQLESTDHDHLGKVLTYAAGYDADIVVWIAKQIREEHRQTLEWLNQRTDSSTEVFGLVVEVLQIDDSRPACNFDVVVRPNQWRKETAVASARKTSERGEAYRSFFQSLIDRLREQHRFTNARAAQPQNWYAFAAGVSGIAYGANFTQDGRARAEIYLDPSSNLGVNKRLFDSMLQHEQEIKADFGDSLEWERMDNRRACRIAIYRPGRIQNDALQLEKVEDWMVQQLLKLKEFVMPKVREAWQELPELELTEDIEH